MKLWSAGVYWPVWLGLFVGTFLLREIAALATGHPEATLSDWVWKVLRITQNETPAAWSATDYLIFGVWVVLFTWLTWHFFFRRFT